MDPNDEHGYYYLGTIKQMTNNNQEAITYFQRAVTINPHYFEALLNLGTANF